MKKTIVHACLLSIFVVCLGLSTVYAQQASIKIMCYNIHIASPPSIKPAFSYTDLPAVAEVINREKPDLVSLQEVDKYTVRSGKDSHQAKDLGALTGMEHHFADAVDRSEGVQGVAVLSRYPIKEARQYKLPAEEGSTSETRSLALIVTEIAGLDVVFASLHIDHLSDVTRAHQLDQVFAHLEEYRHYPIIFSGDFNMRPGNPLLAELTARFAKHEGEWPLTFPAVEPQTTLDYILLNDRAAQAFEVVDYYTVDEQYASDHLPVVMEIRPR